MAAAAPDGTARVTHTPTEAGVFELIAFSTNHDGVRSGTGWEVLAVDGAAPSVTSAEYPQWSEAGGPGVREGHYTVSS